MSLILIVDDDEAIRNSLYEVFSEEHFCQTAETVAEAIALLEAKAYDVVITDISMPGPSGLELFGHIRQKYPKISVIVISGIGDREHAHGLAKLGAFAHLQKPFELDIVEESVKRALALREPIAKDAEDNATD